MKKLFCIATVLLTFSVLPALYAQPADTPLPSPADSLPVPANIPELLFYIQRDPNANTIVYTLNLDERGKLLEKEPIRVYWIRYAEGGEQQELNYIQRRFAYGMNSHPLADGSHELKFVSYDKLLLHLRRDASGRHQVYALINKQEAVLERVFVRIEGGSFWVPKVRYVELKGRDARSGKPLIERFKP